MHLAAPRPHPPHRTGAGERAQHPLGALAREIAALDESIAELDNQIARW